MTKLKELNDQTFKKEVLESAQPVLVDFWASWCGPCMTLTPVLEKVAGKFEGRLKIFKLDVDQNQETAANFQILSIPCLIIFKKGAESGRLIGFMDENKLSKNIEETLKKG